MTALASPPPIGSLTDRVALQRRTTTTEDEGGETTLFMPLATVWARVRPLSGRFTQSNDGRAVAITHAVVLRYRADVQPGDRLVFDGRNLEIVTATDLNGRRAYLSCSCSETAITG